MSIIKDAFDALTGKSAAKDAKKAAKLAAAGQEAALEYLKEREEIPQQFREGALGVLGGLVGLEGGTGSQQDLIDQAMASPLYSAIMGTADQGAETLADYAAATGNLRSGNLQENLFDYGQRLSERALLESYNDQRNVLGGLAGLPSNVNQIAAATAAPYNTMAQGQIAGAQAQQSALSGLLGLGGTLGGAILSGMKFSDPILKRNIRPVGERNGFTVYAWEWNEGAKEFGLEGVGVGYMADEVQATRPDAVRDLDGHLIVDYAALERAAA